MALLFPEYRYSALQVPPPEGGPRKKGEPVEVRSVGSTYPSAWRIAVMADKSRRANLVCAMLAMTTIALGAPAAPAANVEGGPPIHEGPWPIRNGFDRQPTEHELRASGQEDVTPHEAREIDRLYNQLLPSREKVRNRPAAPKH
jgi:hypothetical protein